jgi:hypothetical protein
VAGAVQHAEAPVGELEYVAVLEHPVHEGSRAVPEVGAIARGVAAAAAAVAAHQVIGEYALLDQRPRVARQPAVEARQRTELGAAAVDDRAREPPMVDVLMREHDATDVLDPPAVRLEPTLERIDRSGVRLPGVDERERIVLDEVDVHRPDGPRGRDTEARHAHRSYVNAR